MGVFMKKLFLACLLCVSTGAFAATSTQSIRTTTEFVSIGDSQSAMRKVLGNPDSSYNYVLRDNRGRPIDVTDFYYKIDGLNYTVTVIAGSITRITWER